MAEALTIQGMIDANVDVNTIEQAANEDMIVTARNGREFASVPMASRIILEQGTIDATLETTKAALDADTVLVDGDFALVYNDDDVDLNGYYQKQSGVWEYLPYNIQRQALNQIEQAKQAAIDAAAIDAQDKSDASKAYTDIKTSNIVANDSKPIRQDVDAEFNIVNQIDADGGLRVVGLDDTVQNEIKNVKEVANLTSNISSFTHTFTDDNDQVLTAIGKDGGIYGTGSSVSIQEHIGLHGRELSEKTYTAKDLFTPDVDRYVTNMVATHQQYAPMPFGMLPQNYTVPNSIVSNLTLSNPTDFIPIDTPYGINDKVVHPYIAEIKGGFRGYRYIMCITPYTAESNENPVIYGANDFKNWEMLTGFEQPLALPEPNRFLSDNGLCYNPNTGELVCYWRNSEQLTSEDSVLYYRSTRDGIKWTEAKVMLSADPSSLHISPSVVFNPIDGLFHLWAIEGGGTLRHYTASDLDDNWTQVSSQLLAGLWHCEAKWVGDKYMLLVNVSGTRSNFYFAISSDGNTWTEGADMLTPDPDHVYKASFLPKIVGETIAFDVFYTTNHADFLPWKRRFFHLTTNFVALGA